MSYAPQDVCVAAAVNDRQILENCLARSPDIARGTIQLRIYEGYASAGRAYSKALSDAGDKIALLVHQDVYLPAGFLERLLHALNLLSAADPDWAVAGVVGMNWRAELVGHVWSTGLGRIVGTPGHELETVETLDELLLVVRPGKVAGFDENLPGFHLYATDIVQSAKAIGWKSYVIDVPVIHHDRPIISYDASYKRAYRYMQTKWRDVLPIPNLCVPIERSPITLWIRDARVRWWRRGLNHRPTPTSNPQHISRRLGFEAHDDTPAL